MNTFVKEFEDDTSGKSITDVDKGIAASYLTMINFKPLHSTML